MMAALPRLLDLFCAEGGAAAGYMAAGFEVTGVDNRPSVGRRYPGAFILGDAIQYARDHGHEYDAIHASPPCQAYSIATAGTPGARAKHPRLIAATRDALIASGRPYVIENVAGARGDLRDPVTLCGTMFGLAAIDTDGTRLELRRHRLFEVAGFHVWQPDCRHGAYGDAVGGVYGGGRSDRRETREIRRGGYTPAVAVRAALMGIDWMTMHGLSQALPPAYTRYLGEALLEALMLDRAVSA